MRSIRLCLSCADCLPPAPSHRGHPSLGGQQRRPPPHSQCPLKPDDLSARARLQGKSKACASWHLEFQRKTIGDTLPDWMEHVGAQGKNFTFWYIHLANWGPRTHRRVRQSEKLRENNQPRKTTKQQNTKTDNRQSHTQQAWNRMVTDEGWRKSLLLQFCWWKVTSSICSHIKRSG